MRHLIGTTRKRLIPLLGVSVLLTGGIGASVLFTGGTADAATCATTTPFPVVAGTPCDITGTLSMIAGALTVTPPPAVAWTETVNGLDQQLSDPTAADQTYTVDDATGSAAGWNVTAEATPFTYAVTLPAPHTYTLGLGTTTPTFATNGSLTTSTGTGNDLMTSATAPGAACIVVATVKSICTLPTDAGATGKVTYPVNLTLGSGATGQAADGTGTAAPLRIYNADALTGLGTIVIGTDAAAGDTGDNPVGWWINVPSNTFVGTYTSTVTLQLNSGP
jgi:hypothetical protein